MHCCGCVVAAGGWLFFFANMFWMIGYCISPGGCEIRASSKATSGACLFRVEQCCYLGMHCFGSLIAVGGWLLFTKHVFILWMIGYCISTWRLQKVAQLVQSQSYHSHLRRMSLLSQTLLMLGNCCGCFVAAGGWLFFTNHVLDDCYCISPGGCEICASSKVTSGACPFWVEQCCYLGMHCVVVDVSLLLEARPAAPSKAIVFILQVL